MKIPAIACFLLLGLAACTSIPNAELTQYRAAFAEANAAKDDVLIDFDAAIAEAKAYVVINTRNDAAKKTSPFPSSLNEPGSAGPDATEARRAAWRVVERYNSVLGDLAEGKSDEAVRNAVGGLGNSIGNFVQAASGSAVPGLGALIEGAQTVAGEIEKARRAKEFKSAVRKGRPLVEKILKALTDDAGDQYTIRQALMRDRFFQQMSSLTTSVGALYGLFEAYKAPTPSSVAASPAPSTPGAVDLDGGAFLAAINQRVNVACLPLATLMLDYPFAMGWADAGGAPFTAVAKNSVELSTVDIEHKAAALAALIKEVGGVQETLKAYRTLLVKTADGLQRLDQALDAPVDLEGVAEDISATVFKLKKSLETYRMERAKAGTAAISQGGS